MEQEAKRSGGSNRSRRARRQRGGGRGGLIAARIGLVLLSLTLGAGAVELAVRAALDLYRCDEKIGWTFQRNRTGFKFNRPTRSLIKVRLNRHGFRGEDRPLEKAPGVHRTLILGDSFTAGLHVEEEDTFAALLEASLNARRADGASFEVINAGVPGYSTAQELQLFREIGWRHQPDVVVLAVYLGNDLRNNYIQFGACHYLVSMCGRPYYEMEQGRLVPIDQGTPQRAETIGWADGVLGFSLLYRNFFQDRDIPVSDEERGSYNLYGTESNTRGPPIWVTTMELLVQTQNAVEVYGIPFVVLVVTTEPEVIPSDATPTYRMLRESFVAYLQQRNISYVEPLAGLVQSEKDGRRPYYDDGDHHWNERGHEIAADSMEKFFTHYCAELDLPMEGCEPRVSAETGSR